MSIPAKRKPELLPVNYKDAKTALAKCGRVDECKSWSDKALALKSYAKQMKDTSLEDLAQRIRDRAVRRGGELLEQVKTAKNQHDARARGGASPSRTEAAKQAGLSPDQAKQMLRVARVPEDTFESMVEATKPATVEQLAEAGTQKSERVRPEPFRNEWLDWTQAIKRLVDIPACGFEVLAARRPDAIDELREQCAAAMSNLVVWRNALETFHVSTRKASQHDDGETARCDQRGAA